MSQRVTAILPCHNHARWVLDALRSVASQDHEAMRLVVVDDGSTDGSHEVVLGSLYRPSLLAEGVWLGRLKDAGRNVLLLRHATAMGPAAARNRGIQAAWDDTDYFALLDSDDVYEPGKVARSLELFALAPQELAVVYSDYDTLRPDGLRLRQYKEPFSRAKLLRECIVNCDSLVSRHALERVGLFDATLRVAEDYDLWLRLSEHFLLAHLPESLVTIRVGQHSSTATVAGEVWQRCHRRVFEKLHERQRR